MTEQNQGWTYAPVENDIVPYARAVLVEPDGSTVGTPISQTTAKWLVEAANEKLERERRGS